MIGHRTPVLVAIAVVAATVSGCSSAPALTDRDTVIVSDFVNTTGDAVFDTALKPAVQVALQQSPFITMLTDQRLQPVLRAMRRPMNEALTGDAARELCKAAHGRAVIGGSIAASGSGYTVTLEATDCQTGASLAKQSAQASGKPDVIAQVGSAVKALRQSLGEPAATLQKYDADLTRAASASLEAMAAYGQGIRTRATLGDEAAVPAFQQAIMADPSCGIAHAKLAVVLANIGMLPEARIETEKAFALKDPMTEYERLFIAWNEAVRVSGDQQAIKASLEALTSTYPRDFSARNNFGVYYDNAGQLEDALKQYRAASEIAPEEPGPLSNSAYVLMTMGKYDEASEATDRALVLRPDANLAITRWIAARVADLPRAGEFENVARQLAGPDQMALAEASLAAWSGKFDQFQKMQGDAIARAKATGNTDLAEGLTVGRTIMLAAYRRGHDLDALKAAAVTEKNPAILAQQSSVLAMLGEIDAVRSGLKRLNADKSSEAVGPPLTVVRAYVQAKDGQAAAGIAALQSTLAALPRARDLNYYVADLREQSGDADGAIAGYRVVVNSLTYLGPNPLIPAARLKLAKLLIKKGDQAGAREQLDALIKQWRDAEGEFPALTDAKALRGQIK